MKILPFLLFCLTSSMLVTAQKKAVTQTGEEVILFDDGTWKYANQDEGKKNGPSLNPTLFIKDETATFLLKSQKGNLGVWLDPKKWSFKKAVENPEAEYELNLKEGDLYAMLIAEKVEIPLESLRDIAIENAKSAAPDIKVVKEEYRNVNGLKVLLLQLNGTIQGIKFSYYGYYYSNEKGTVQFLTYTSQNLLKDYLKDCELLLNGLVEIK